MHALHMIVSLHEAPRDDRTVATLDGQDRTDHRVQQGVEREQLCVLLLLSLPPPQGGC